MHIFSKSRLIVSSGVSKTRRLLVADEDYQHFGLSGELAALALENFLKFKFGRVSIDQTIPFPTRLSEADYDGGS